MDALDLIKLNPLLNITMGNPELTIGIIDGPVDFAHPAFQESQIRTANESQHIACKLADSIACTHGTFVTGILASSRGSSAAAICPACRFVLRPIFNEEGNPNGNMPSSTPAELAIAIKETIDAGAKIINLSLGLSIPSIDISSELDEALTYARKQEVIIVAATGNQGIMGHVPLIDYPWVIPVVACDEQGNFNPESNVGPSIGQRGVMAPGSNITSTAPGGIYTQLSGTSVATPFVTGAIALIWSEFPEATAAEILHSITSTARQNRRAIIPSMLNAEAAWKTLETNHQKPSNQRMVEIMSNENMSIASSNADAEHVIPLEARQAVPDVASTGITPLSTGQPYPTEKGSVLTMQADAAGNCPTCGANHPVAESHQSFIYAIGTVETPRFPNLSVEKQFAQAVRAGATENLADREVIYNILKENRYLALEVCWPYSIDGLEVYVLAPRDPLAIDHLIEAIKPSDHRQLDRDIVIGVRGPLAPMEMCNGLMVPIVMFDQIYSFDIPTLIKSIPKPKDIEEKIFRSASEEVFNRISQMANNVGAMDEHRAVNYLVVQYPAIYSKTAEMHVQDYSLTRIETRLSRVSVGRKIIDVIFTYVNRNTYFKEQFYAAVDVTEKWVFMTKPLGLYLET